MNTQMSIWQLLKPNWFKVVSTIILFALSLFVITGAMATSKVSWYENRGIPLTCLRVAKMWPCGPGPDLDEICIYLEAVYPFALLVDILSFYLVSCAVGSVLGKIKSLVIKSGSDLNV